MPRYIQRDTYDGARSRAVFWLFAMVIFAAASGYAIYWAGFWAGQREVVGEDGRWQAAAALAATLADERQALAASKQEVTAGLDALGGRLGRMQGELLRLNALGERLVAMAGLDAEELRFDVDPPMGGPEQPEDSSASLSDLTAEADGFLTAVQDRERKLSLIEELIMERELTAAAVPAGQPVRSGYITSRFGYRTHPITGKRSFHRGVDFAAKRGAEVIAVADGVVVASGAQSGYGRTVEIRHANGMVTRYAHNEKNLVQVGDIVKQGETIAKLGATGRATGPHVHFEVLKDGAAVNPMNYVQSASGGPRS